MPRTSARPPTTPTARASARAAAAVVVLVAELLAGCAPGTASGGAPTPSTPTYTAPAPAAPTPTPAPAPAAPTPAPTTPAPAPATDHRRGPDPTTTSLEAPTGPFDVATTVVARDDVSDFGGATVYYPTARDEGTFGAVAISPGYTGDQSGIAWYGPRLASQGFVVITIDTVAPKDYPDRRGDQLLAALDWLTTDSPVRDRVDPDRLAVMGHSMGGGGSLEAATDRPSLRAAVPLTPWDRDTTWPEVTTPTLIVAAQDDDTASPQEHALPFYGSLTNTRERAYLELAGADHLAPARPDTTIAAYVIAWLKLFVDDDVRYAPFLCPGPQVGPTVSAWQSTCPM